MPYSKSLLVSAFLLMVLGLFSQGNPEPSGALFIANQGQWEGDFHHKLPVNGGAVFFHSSGFVLDLSAPSEHDHDSDHHHHHQKDGQAIALNFHWLDADRPVVLQDSIESYPHHYILGNDPQKWRSNVPVSRGLDYYQLYPGIDLKFFGNGPNLEYDIVLAAGADPELLRLKVEGSSYLKNRGDALHIGTPFGEIIERIPYAYQEIGGQVYEVRCRYKVVSGVVQFDLGQYNANYPVIIDPILEFSTFTGSTSDNFGFTATYDPNGNFYAGGIAFTNGYPVTTGAYQRMYGGGENDISITKFSSDGSQALYSTYIGGRGADLPHSMIVDGQGNLYVFGTTSSNNFPVTSNAVQDTFSGGPAPSNGNWIFSNGADIYVLRLSADGSSLLSSTFFGGTGTDGLNLEVYANYADDGRGEITLDAQNNVYIASCTRSTDIVVNGSVLPAFNRQDALVISLNANLSAVRWARILGGASLDVAYSVKPDKLGNLYVSGSTETNNIPLGANDNVAFSSYKGATDGFLYQLNSANGNIIRGTYIGGGGHDQAFFVDVDRNDFPYVFGQTNAPLAPTPGVYANSGSRQYVAKLEKDLRSYLFYAPVGSGRAKTDFVPTAFLVDDCYRIYMSGWGGNTNSSAGGGNTNNLPVTPDAQQSSTDGSDFYFMVLDRNASGLLYASFFGGSSSEHVDGGTSRFDPKGIIYQAICAGCGQQGFPTTPGAYSRTNRSNNCNLGAVKFDFQSSVRASAQIDFANADTLCNTLFIDFINRSMNADLYYWDFGNGSGSTDENPRARFDNFGTYRIRLIAHDTVCDQYDTAYVSLNHDEGAFPTSRFKVDYQDCDKTFRAKFENTSLGAGAYEWDFGDGNSSTAESPTHFYPGVGIYEVELTVTDTLCFNTDTFSLQIEFTDTIPAPTASVRASECRDGSLDIEVAHAKPWYEYQWSKPGGESYSGKNPRIVYPSSGKHYLDLLVIDTLCNATYSSSYSFRIAGIIKEVYMPNAFTPNGDGINETLAVSGSACTESDRLVIFNRWGQRVFETNAPYSEFWDGMVNGSDSPATVDIYTYVLYRGSERQTGHITLMR